MDVSNDKENKVSEINTPKFFPDSYWNTKYESRLEKERYVTL